MQFKSVAIAAFAISAAAQSIATSSAASATPSANVTTINTATRVDSVCNATVWSLIVSCIAMMTCLERYEYLILRCQIQYLYPLYIFGNFAGNVIRNVGVITIFHQRNLASVDSPGVIKPNIDTLYSRVVLDLSQSDVALTIPNINDGRYWNYPVIDS